MATPSSPIKGSGNAAQASVGTGAIQVVQQAQKVIERVGLASISINKDRSQSQQTTSFHGPKLSPPKSQNDDGGVAIYYVNMAIQLKTTLDAIQNTNQAIISNLDSTAAQTLLNTNNQVQQIEAQNQSSQTAATAGDVGKIISWVSMGVAAIIGVAGVVSAVFTGGSSLAVAAAAIALIGVGLSIFLSTSAGQDTVAWVSNQTANLLTSSVFEGLMTDIVKIFDPSEASSVDPWLQKNAQEVASIIVKVSVVVFQVALMVVGLGCGVGAFRAAGDAEKAAKAAKDATKAAEDVVQGLGKMAIKMQSAQPYVRKFSTLIQISGDVLKGGLMVSEGATSGVVDYANNQDQNAAAQAIATQTILNILTKITQNSSQVIKDLQKLNADIVNNAADIISMYMQSMSKMDSNISA